MYRIITILFFLAAFGGQAYAQQDIEAIRVEFKKINSMPLTKKEFKYESAGCVDGGVVQYFLDKGDIVKITESGSIGDGSWVREFYFQAGKCIFCYDTQVGGPAIGPVTKTEYRVYVNDGKIIRVMEDKKIVTTDTKAIETVGTAAKLLKAYEKKNFAEILCN